MPKGGGKKEKKLAEADEAEETKEIVYDVDHVDYGKSCSRVFATQLKNIFEFCFSLTPSK